MTEPNIAFNGLGILLAMTGAFVFGGVWYGPLFGKTWGRLMGMDMTKKPERKVLMRAMGLQAFGLVLTAYCLSYSMNVWRPSVWGVGSDGPNAMYGVMAAFFTWIGFYIPLQLNKIAWEMRPWKLFFINAGHDLINLLIISEILAFV